MAGTYIALKLFEEKFRSFYVYFHVLILLFNYESFLYVLSDYFSIILYEINCHIPYISALISFRTSHNKFFCLSEYFFVGVYFKITYYFHVSKTPALIGMY